MIFLSDVDNKKGKGKTWSNTTKKDVINNRYGGRRLYAPPKRNKNVLPNLSEIPTPWTNSLDNAAGKLDSNVLVNPVRNTFQSTEPRKPLTELIIPKSPKPSNKDTKKLLKNLGVAGVVSGGLLGAYGLHKYFQSKNKEK